MPLTFQASESIGLTHSVKVSSLQVDGTTQGFYFAHRSRSPGAAHTLLTEAT